MFLLIEQVTERTPCPHHHGGETYHFPFCRNGKPVTQPGPEDHRYGGSRPVMLALCFSARNHTYLVPPRETTNPITPQRMCPVCVEALALDLAHSPGKFIASAC